MLVSYHPLSFGGKENSWDSRFGRKKSVSGVSAGSNALNSARPNARRAEPIAAA